MPGVALMARRLGQGFGAGNAEHAEKAVGASGVGLRSGEPVNLRPAPPGTGNDNVSFDLARDSFARDIRRARTFGFLSEVENLRSRGPGYRRVLRAGR